MGADIKHVLRTVAESVDFKGSFQFVLVDPNPHVQARNLVLLSLLLRQNEDDQFAVLAFTRALYSLHLDAKTFHLMKMVFSDILQGMQTGN